MLRTMLCRSLWIELKAMFCKMWDVVYKDALLLNKYSILHKAFDTPFKYHPFEFAISVNNYFYS